MMESRSQHRICEYASVAVPTKALHIDGPSASTNAPCPLPLGNVRGALRLKSYREERGVWLLKCPLPLGNVRGALRLKSYREERGVWLPKCPLLLGNVRGALRLKSYREERGVWLLKCPLPLGNVCGVLRLKSYREERGVWLVGSEDSKREWNCRLDREGVKDYQ
ncbi:hypothetical protein E1301_Tti023605 [Triplophysa tibetana]|uniref:Uncharacterized protein n=1 Tax=Triplophysa tibetana TaxID=1572043 RepID=A0A5A9PIY8_9TELE|nr:hypothetical protein E1301_Tti023605 [Triplophysa tibetana]